MRSRHPLFVEGRCSFFVFLPSLHMMSRVSRPIFEPLSSPYLENPISFVNPSGCAYLTRSAERAFSRVLLPPLFKHSEAFFPPPLFFSPSSGLCASARTRLPGANSHPLRAAECLHLSRVRLPVSIDEAAKDVRLVPSVYFLFETQTAFFSPRDIVFFSLRFFRSPFEFRSSIYFGRLSPAPRYFLLVSLLAWSFHPAFPLSFPRPRAWLP